MSFDFTGRFPAKRPRRMRRDDFSRRLVRETRLGADDFIYPVFVHDGERREAPVPSLPGVVAQVDRPAAARRRALRRRRHSGDRAVPGHSAPSRNPTMPPSAWNDDGLVPRTVRALKARFPALGVITDIALDPYTSHGQDGLIDDDRLRDERRDRRGAGAARRFATRRPASTSSRRPT